MRRERARRISYKGEVEYRDEATPLCREPGDVALVKRGRPRSVAMACPDGCGEMLTVNLDDRSGPAWWFYSDAQGHTLYPSVWRETGCRSHFILWNDRILWCGAGGLEERVSGRVDAALESRVLAALGEQPRHYSQIARELDAIPWEVARACDGLVHAGLARAGRGQLADTYRRSPPRSA